MNRIFWIVLLAVGVAACAEVDGQFVPTFLQPHPPAPAPSANAATASALRAQPPAAKTDGPADDRAKCEDGDVDRCAAMRDHRAATALLEQFCDQGNGRACLKAVENLEVFATPPGRPTLTTDVLPRTGFKGLDVKDLLYKACLALNDGELCLRAGDYKSGFGAASESSEKTERPYSKACDAGAGRGCRLAGILSGCMAGMAPCPAEMKVAVDLWRKGCALDDAESCTLAGEAIRDKRLPADVPTVAGEPRQLIGRGCDLGSAAGCVALGKLDKACELHDVATCNKLCDQGNAKACEGASEEFKQQRAAARAAAQDAKKGEAALPGLFARCAANRVRAQALRDQAVAAFRAGDAARAEQFRSQLDQMTPAFQETIHDVETAIAAATGGSGPRAGQLVRQAREQCLLPPAR